MEFTNTETFCTGCHEMHDNLLCRPQKHHSLHQSLRRARDVLELPRAARVDGQDGAQDASFERGVGKDIRNRGHPREIPRTSGSSSPARMGASSRRTTHWNAGTVTTTNTWTSPDKASGRRTCIRRTWRTRKRPASIATRALRTGSRTSRAKRRLTSGNWCPWVRVECSLLQIG